MGRLEVVYVYVILTHFGTYYTGITNNLKRRMSEHEAGKSSYLKKFKPKQLVYIEECECRKVAAKKEAYIKKNGAKKFLLKLKYKE